jgi:hypothetical protein
MGVYQILTDFLGLPSASECGLVQTHSFDNYLNKES